MTNSPYVVANFKWLVPTGYFPYAKDLRIATTGFREAEGIDDLFSIIVEFLGVDQKSIPACEQIRIYALNPAMNYRLPLKGESFIVTAGFKPVASCLAKEVHALC